MPSRVFVYECLTAGDFPPPVPRSLRREGWAMLHAVAQDFSRIPDVEVTTIAPPGYVGLRKRRFQACAAEADYTLIIAPELHGLLERRYEWAMTAGGCVLGPTMGAVKLTSDKLAFGRFLKKREIPTPDTWLASGGMPTALRGHDTRMVLKPRWGAGSVDTFLLNGDSLRRKSANDLIVQPYIPGVPASVAWLLGPRQQIPLAPALQRLSKDGRFRYLGGRVPLPPDLSRRALQLTRRAVEAVPGLAGYVGVDIVLGKTASEDKVIEINPRLTTSYLGLRKLAKVNLAEVMLKVSRGERVPEIRWKRGPVVFSCLAASLRRARGSRSPEARG